MRLRILIFALAIVGTVWPVFAQGSNSIQFQYDNVQWAGYIGQAEAYLSHAIRSSAAVSSQSLETSTTKVMFDAYTLMESGDENARWVNFLNASYKQPVGNAGGGYLLSTKVVCNGVTFDATSDPVGAVKCNLANNAAAIGTVQSELAALQTISSDPTYTGFINSAVSSFSHVQGYFSAAQNDANALTNPLTPPSVAVQTALYYGFGALDEIGVKCPCITSAGKAFGEMVAEIQSGTTVSMSIDTNILDNIQWIHGLVFVGAYPHIAGLRMSGLIHGTPTPIQEATMDLMEPTNNVPYRIGTDLDVMGNLNGTGSSTPLDLHFKDTVKYLGNAWRNTDGMAYAILDSILTGCTQ